jgi:hypothetical protein
MSWHHHEKGKWPYLLHSPAPSIKSQSTFEDFMSDSIQFPVSAESTDTLPSSLNASSATDFGRTAEGDCDNTSMFGDPEIW